MSHRSRGKDLNDGLTILVDDRREVLPQEVSPHWENRTSRGILPESESRKGA